MIFLKTDVRKTISHPFIHLSLLHVAMEFAWNADLSQLLGPDNVDLGLSGCAVYDYAEKGDSSSSCVLSLFVPGIFFFVFSGKGGKLRAV